jgi:hypothetical protein
MEALQTSERESQLNQREVAVEKVKVPTTTVVQGEPDQPGEVKPEQEQQETVRRETHEVETQERTEQQQGQTRE